MKSKIHILLGSLFIAGGTMAADIDTEGLPQLEQWQDGEDRQHAVTVREVTWRIPTRCLPTRDLGSDAGARDLGSDAGARDLGSDAGARDLGSDAGARDLGSDAGARDLGSDAGARDLGSDAGARDLGSDAGARDLGSDAGARDLGSDAGARDLGSDAGARDLGSDAIGPRCVLGERQESVIIIGVSRGVIDIPPGSRLSDIQDGPWRNSVRVRL